MLKGRKSAVGLDIGTSCIKAVEVTRDKYDYIITGFGKIEVQNDAGRPDAIAELFQECLVSPQSAALIHVFFGERAVAKIPDIPKDTPKIEIKKAAIIGSGTMGGGIAMVYANAGIPVLLKEIKQEFLDRGMATIQRNYDNTMKKGRMTQEEVDRRMSLITPTLSWDGFGEADIVVEAVFEEMSLKKEIFAKLD